MLWSAAMASQCEALQREIRSLLTRLSPAGASDGTADLLRLQRLLEDLVQAWNTSPGQTVHFALADCGARCRRPCAAVAGTRAGERLRVAA